jgi:hypothetical protein
MIIPAIGYVPDWMIYVPVCLVGALLTVINLKLKDKLSRFERSFSVFGAQIAVRFTWISTKTRKLQVDTLNKDILMLALGLLLVFALSSIGGGP